MNLNSYQFQTKWAFTAPPDHVYLALAQLDDYPAWWPEVRAVRRVDDASRRITCRSVLPYSLNFVSSYARQDRDAGILEARLSGDLDGFSSWTISATSEGCYAVFDEQVTAHKALLRKLALVARPAFRLNHALMMRHGLRGLNAYLAGMRLGLADPES